MLFAWANDVERFLGAEMEYMLSKVEDVITIKGRGIIIMPGIPDYADESVKVLIDGLRLKCPDDSILETQVCGIEMGGNGQFTPLLLGEEIDKGDIPVGTEVWVVPHAR